MSRTNPKNRFRGTGGDRVQDQFGFLMTKGPRTGGVRSRQSNVSSAEAAANQAKAKQNLKNFIGNTFGSAIDSVTLGATDFDKKGDSPFQAGLKNTLSGAVDSFKRKETADPNQTQLPGQAFNEDKFYRNLRGMQVTDSLLRDYEMGREQQRNLNMFRQTMPLVDIAAETAAQRRLMEDRQSPTKISQQILRARTGEAALMDAVARQGNTAVNIATAGLAPRGRAGGR